VIGALKETSFNDNSLADFSVDGETKEAELIFEHKPSNSNLATVVKNIAAVGHIATIKPT
jgi:hypothetical protein